MGRDVGRISNVTLEIAVDGGQLKSAGNVVKTSTAQPGKTASTENVRDLEQMAISVFLTRTVPLATVVVSLLGRSAENVVKTSTVQPGKTASTKNVRDLEPMAIRVFLTQTVPLATAVVSGLSKSAGNAVEISIAQPGKIA